MFSNNALFQGLAVFIDTYSNDDATDVSGLLHVYSSACVWFDLARLSWRFKHVNIGQTPQNCFAVFERVEHESFLFKLSVREVVCLHRARYATSTLQLISYRT